MTEQCKTQVMRGYHVSKCSRKAKWDGFCIQHHPDTIAKREEKSEAKWKAAQARSPWALLKKAETELRHYRRIYGTDRVALEYEYGVQDMVILKKQGV